MCNNNNNNNDNNNNNNNNDDVKLYSSNSHRQQRGVQKTLEPNLFRQGMDKRAHIYFFNIFIAFVGNYRRVFQC